MAFTPVFMDCFQSYPLTTALTHSKWTSGSALPTAIVGEDGNQAASGGALTKVLSGAAGHILVSRCAASFATGETCIFKVSGTLSQSVRLTYNESTNRVVLTTPDAVAHTSTQIFLQNGFYFTYEFVYQYTGTAFNYQLFIDGNEILDVGSTIATASVPSMTDISIFHSTGPILGMNKRDYIGVKAWDGNDGAWADSDLYTLATPGTELKRGVLYPDSDGRWPASTPSRSWIPSSGTTYFGVLDETLASTSDYISEFTDVGGTPGGAPDYLDRASWSYTASPALVLSVPHVQLNNLVQMVNGSATYTLYLKNNVADDTAEAITPITAPSSWAWRLDSYGEDPRNGDIPWTKALIDTIEVGIEPINFT